MMGNPGRKDDPLSGVPKRIVLPARASDEAPKLENILRRNIAALARFERIAQEWR